jgi:hypothetical protein
MKNKLNFLIVIAVMFFVIGCSCGRFADFGSKDTSTDKTKTSDSTSNKSLTDRATDVVTEGEKIGVPECDELMDYFRTKIENENTDFVTKAVLKTLEARFREGIKKSLEENKSNTAETAKFCKEFKKNLDEQEAKQSK